MEIDGEPLPFSHHCEGDHYGNGFLLWIYSPVTSNRCFQRTHRPETLVTEPHVGYSKNQIAQAVLATELDTTPANGVIIDAVAKFCPPSDQRGQQGEMHDVFLVISEGGAGGHIVRTVYAADEDDARQTHQDNYADEALVAVHQ